jgi:hypothetical protein
VSKQNLYRFKKRHYKRKSAEKCLLRPQKVNCMSVSASQSLRQSR